MAEIGRLAAKANRGASPGVRSNTLLSAAKSTIKFR